MNIMKIRSQWHSIYEGSGSLSGNEWLEEVCYLGQERWLLSLRDDPAWSMVEVDVQEPEEKTTAELIDWVIDMDTTDGEDDYSRTLTLLAVAKAVGAAECEAQLRRYVATYGMPGLR